MRKFAVSKDLQDVHACTAAGAPYDADTRTKTAPAGCTFVEPSVPGGETKSKIIENMIRTIAGPLCWYAMRMSRKGMYLITTLRSERIIPTAPGH